VQQLTNLTSTTTGTYLITTYSGSRYLLNLDRMSVIRVPHSDDAAGWSPFQDADKIEVIALGECNVGEPLLLMLDLLPGFDFTRCITTPVVSIEKIDFDPADGPPDDESVTENVK
jgi:hypothetical protein